MKRIGILGGTFNPIHIGHLAMAEAAREQLRLDRVIFVPAYLPPHKSGKNVISAKDRCRMVELAVAGAPCFEVSDIEIKRKGKSYSIDTIKEVRRRFPAGTKVFFIIGEDNLAGLPKWKSIKELLGLVNFVVINRAGNVHPKAYGMNVRFVPMPRLDISASDIRKKIAAGWSVKYFIPDQVLAYMKRKRLYQQERKKKINERKDQNGSH